MPYDGVETRLSPFGINTPEEVWKKHLSNPYDIRQVAAKHDRDLFKRGVSATNTAIMWQPEDEELLRRLLTFRHRKNEPIMMVARAAGIGIYTLKRLAWSLKLDVMDNATVWFRALRSNIPQQITGSKRIVAPFSEDFPPNYKVLALPGNEEPVSKMPMYNPWNQFVARVPYTRRRSIFKRRRNKFHF